MEENALICIVEAMDNTNEELVDKCHYIGNELNIDIRTILNERKLLRKVITEIKCSNCCGPQVGHKISRT